ncbi:hypothetical protein EYF80_052967 [Liparis tanakae]|uniref:Uncharacterized protein n=1 Tax=Liparis tanakae TaxID=230148 RepID=A0A4Z2F7L0_9TELE|nr:hypothetical protein EYF80_052967 [Liparis tanakae]
MEVQQHVNNTPQSIDTEDTEDVEDTEDMKDTEDREDVEDTEDVEDMKDREDVEDTEDTEDMKDREDVEDTEDVEDREDVEDTEDTEDMKDTEDREDVEDTEDMKDTEDREDVEDTEDVEDREDMKDTDRGHIIQTSDTQRNTEEDEDEDEVLLKAGDKWSEGELQTLFPTMHRDTPLSHDIHDEEDRAGDWLVCCPIGQQDEYKEAGTQDACLSEAEDCGTCSPEELLEETVERLKTVMETDRWRERQTGERAELLQAADQVGSSIHHLVDAVRTDAN